jgi:NADH-quinone oxidoreductase subunit J
MTPIHIVFLIVAAVTLFAAGMVVTTRRMMHSALWLILALMGVAIVFAMLDASFFAVVQVLVYIGAIAILIIFAIMLTRRVMEDTGPQMNKGWWLPVVGVVLLFLGIVVGLSQWSGFETLLPPLPADANNLALFGQALTSPESYVIPFEVASILLLAALMGAIYLGTEGKRGKK